MWTAELLDRISAVQLRAVPPDVIAQVRRSIADTISVGVGAVGESYGRMIVEQARLLECPPRATVWGSPVKTSISAAAFANGALAHGLDFDDMLKPVIGHPSAPVVAAALPVAEARGLDGRRFLEGCTAGLETAGRLGELLNVGHYRKGWHPTSVLGTMAAAAAVSRMIGLDRTGTGRALGIAATFAGGIRGTFGTPAKGLQVGNAARGGVEAALLAEAGFEMHLDVMERRFGFFEMFSDDGLAERRDAPAAAPGPAGTIARHGMGYKRYPSCGRIQPAADTLLWLRRKHRLVPDDVAATRCGTYDMAVRTLSFPRPQNGYEARYSMHYCLAAALQHGELGLTHFHDRQTKDARVSALIDRIELAIDPSLGDTERFPSRLTLTLRDGRQLSALGLRGANSGTVVVTDEEQEELPITDSELREKWKGCFDAAGAPAGTMERLVGAIDELESGGKLARITAAIALE